MTIPTIPRGIANNNPFNIDFSDENDWDGQVYKPVLSLEHRFAVFQSPAAGIRAGLLNFQAYQDRHGAKTWADLIRRQAPENENDTAAYIAAVHEKTGFEMDSPAATHDWPAMQKWGAAVIQVENGDYEYEPAVWELVRANLAHRFTG
jgi:hypothetical protein